MYKKKGKEIVIEILAIRSQNIFVNANFEYFYEEKINESLHTSINNIKIRKFMCIYRHNEKV